MPTWQGRRLRLMAADFGWLRRRFGGPETPGWQQVRRLAWPTLLVIVQLLFFTFFLSACFALGRKDATACPK